METVQRPEPTEVKSGGQRPEVGRAENTRLLTEFVAFLDRDQRQLLDMSRQARDKATQGWWQRHARGLVKKIEGVKSYFKRSTAQRQQLESGRQELANIQRQMPKRQAEAPAAETAFFYDPKSGRTVRPPAMPAEESGWWRMSDSQETAQRPPVQPSERPDVEAVELGDEWVNEHKDDRFQDTEADDTSQTIEREKSEPAPMAKVARMIKKWAPYLKKQMAGVNVDQVIQALDTGNFSGPNSTSKFELKQHAADAINLVLKNANWDRENRLSLDTVARSLAQEAQEEKDDLRIKQAEEDFYAKETQQRETNRLEAESVGEQASLMGFGEFLKTVQKDLGLKFPDNGFPDRFVEGTFDSKDIKSALGMIANIRKSTEWRGPAVKILDDAERHLKRIQDQET